MEPDGGSVAIARDARLGYYRQSHEIKATGDVMSALLSSFAEVTTLREELARAREDASHVTGESDPRLAKLAELEDRYHHARGDALEHKVSAIVTKLGFKSSDLSRPVSRSPGASAGD